MNRVLILIIALIFQPVCADDSEETPETVWLRDQSVLSCTPIKIKLGESVNLKLGSNHGRELAIYRESENLWIFLVVGSAPKEMKSLMEPAEFKKISSLTLGNKTTGYRWDTAGGNEVIFKSIGKYTVHVSENLESEEGGYECEVSVTNH